MEKGVEKRETGFDIHTIVAIIAAIEGIPGKENFTPNENLIMLAYFVFFIAFIFISYI